MISLIPFLPLSPRYRLDDKQSWLEGIDPSRNYWISVNGEPTVTIALPGLATDSLEAFEVAMAQFRSLDSGEEMQLVRTATACTLYCITENCYAIASAVQGAPAWHLFDQETLVSLLSTGHPDWQCAPENIDLGRRLLLRSWQQSVAA